MERQDWKGKDLDKDLLVPGNKIYSPDLCVMILPNLNKFLTDRKAKRGDSPLGASFHKSSGKFQANCYDPFSGRQVYLGLFSDSDSAHLAWKAKKHELACRYADTVSDPKIASALRLRYAPKSDQLENTHD
jgi:hypothetical protein